MAGPNLDDDDGDGRQDGIDEEVNGVEDVTDLAPFGARIRGFEPEEHRVIASVDQAARDWIKLFSNEDGYPALNAVGDESILSWTFARTSGFSSRGSSDL